MTLTRHTHGGVNRIPAFKMIRTWIGDSLRTTLSTVSGMGSIVEVPLRSSAARRRSRCIRPAYCLTSRHI